jgi:hypothetical protein
MRSHQLLRSGFVLLLFLCTVSKVVSQAAKMGGAKTSTTFHKVDQTALASTSAEIKSKSPRISTEVLEQDRAVIGVALADINSDFNTIGLKEGDAIIASQQAWKTARLNSPLRAQVDKTIDRESFVLHATNDVAPVLVGNKIQSSRPEIPKETINADRRIIDSAQAEIIEAFEKSGRDESDARLATMAAWQFVRLDSPLEPTKAMNRASFIELVSEHIGVIRFLSDPDQADVYIGAEKIGTTNAAEAIPIRYFPDGQTVRARFVKAGFPPQEVDCVAVGRDKVECRATFKSP